MPERRDANLAQEEGEEALWQAVFKAQPQQRHEFQPSSAYSGDCNRLDQSYRNHRNTHSPRVRLLSPEQEPFPRSSETASKFGERKRKVFLAMSDGEPGTNPGFWTIRNSLLPATLEMERAANLLSAAADMILADRYEEAVALIHQADITALFEVREQAVRAPPIFNVHRPRKVENSLPKISKEQRAAPFRSESPLGEAVFRRDGWRCRYCGCRVIPSKVRRWMNKCLPGAIRWDQATNLGCHAGFWTLWGSVDHIIPRARGGRNEVENLVTACMVCNFAREAYTLEQLGLADPRSRPPVLDGWDGLIRVAARNHGPEGSPA